MSIWKVCRAGLVLGAIVAVVLALTFSALKHFGVWNSKIIIFLLPFWPGSLFLATLEHDTSFSDLAVAVFASILANSLYYGTLGVAGYGIKRLFTFVAPVHKE
jgi:ABC-type lipoprotein release transport system permease subunit